ncbi:uncharacterized protein V6R79_018122 [Siganus canaliculatus]
MCPAWLLVVVVVVGVARGAASHCWEDPNCQGRSSESSMKECIQLCHADLTAETPIIPGHAHLQPPPDSAPQTKRSFSLENILWGKPIVLKRHPITDGVKEESAKPLPREVQRQEEQEQEQEQEEEELLGKSRDDSYETALLLRSSLTTRKRYGGFMRSWDERSRRPLLTLFKNLILID